MHVVLSVSLCLYVYVCVCAYEQKYAWLHKIKEQCLALMDQLCKLVLHMWHVTALQAV